MCVVTKESNTELYNALFPEDEIKEILNNQKLINVENDYERIIFEYLANNCSEFDDEHIKQLVNLKVEQYKQSLDYITNLQEENERLKVDKKTIQRWYNLCKSKNEKASKIIQDIFKDENWYKNYEYNDLEDTLKNVDDILNGGDDNE